MTESQARFVRAILERLPAERVVELHLFPPLRQGGAETGVAVIAQRQDSPPDAPGADAVEPGGPPPEGQGTAVAADEHDRSAAPIIDMPADAPADTPAPARRGRRARAVRPARRVAAEPGERHTVFSARYRLTLRGPDRGKWEFDLVEVADAPLVTVDAVVRGVQERAGEEGEPERLGPDALAAIAAPAPWTTAAR
ncbi:MAG: hypothetical protein ACJ8AO_18815 [Gemmatimonadaceae bacterium]